MGGGKPGKYLFCKDSHSDQKDDSSKNAGKGEQTTTFMGFCGIGWMRLCKVEVLQGIGGSGRSWKRPRGFVLSRLCNKRSWRRRRNRS